MKTLLFTGWLGYIGSHTALVFLEQGYDVIILDNCSNSSVWVLETLEKLSGKKPQFYNCDLRNKKEVELIFWENYIDAVIHFAGAKAVGESCENPFYYYENNIIGSLNLFGAMEKYNVKNIVFSSSANIYGHVWISPFREDASTGETSNPYGTSKYIIERLLRDLFLQKSFKVVSLRYFNPIWAHSSWLLGEHANQKLGNILPFILRVAKGEQERIEVYGNNYDTVDGTGVRDYIHVMDLAQGHKKAFEYLENSSTSWFFEAINLGTGKGTSVLELIHIVEQETQRDIPYVIWPRREIDIATAYCSPQKAKQLLWWQAHYSVKQAVMDSWNFIQKQKS